MIALKLILNKLITFQKYTQIRFIMNEFYLVVAVFYPVSSCFMIYADRIVEEVGFIRYLLAIYDGWPDRKAIFPNILITPQLKFFRVSISLRTTE